MLIELGAVPIIAGMIGQRMPPHGETVIGGPMHQELGEVDLPLVLSLHMRVLNDKEIDPRERRGVGVVKFA